MNHEITLTQTDDQWEQVMTCKFASETIAKLIVEDADTITIHGRVCFTDNTAKLEQDKSTITVTCKYRHGYTLNWHTDPSENKDSLRGLAQDWQAQEQAYLPIARYFNMRTRAFNDRFHEWADKRDKELANLEHQIEELERKLDSLNNRLDETNHVMYKELRRYGEILIELKDTLSSHKEARFHFLDRKE